MTGAGSWSTWDVIYDALKAVNSILLENSTCEGEVIKRGGAATPEWMEPSSFQFNPTDPGDEFLFLLIFPSLQSSTIIYSSSQCNIYSEEALIAERPRFKCQH